jgi:hypothetical protein
MMRKKKIKKETRKMKIRKKKQEIIRNGSTKDE